MYILPPYSNYQLIPWLRVFGTLGIEQFNQIYKILDFPVMPTQKNQNIAREFFMTAHKLIDDSTPDIPEFKTFFLKLSQSGLSLKEKQEALFQYTFSSLEEIGDASEIYAWGLNTTHFQSNEDINNFQIISVLLREWAVNEWMKQQKYPVGNDFTEITEMLHAWRDIYENSAFSTLSIPIIPITYKSQERVFSVILDYELLRSKLRPFVDMLKTSLITPWDTFTFYRGTAGGSWIINEGNFRINVNEWGKIQKELSTEELISVENWMLEQKHSYSWMKNFKIPQVSFK